MQTLARLVGQLGKALKSDCSVDKVAKDESRSVWLSVEEKSCSFIEKRLGKRRVALNALNNSLFEITCKRHVFFPFLVVERAFFLALYSSCRATA